MKIRTTIAVMAAKITGHVCKLMGRQGVTWAGKIALKICPDILEELSSQVREKIFVVCGTNGKTTTKELAAAVLSQKHNENPSSWRYWGFLRLLKATYSLG